MTAREMLARFPGTCAACKGPIRLGTPILWSKTSGAVHSSFAGCEASKREGVSETKTIGVDVSGLVAFLRKAQENGLRFPKARFLGPEGKGELRLSLCGPNAKFPGAVTVQLNGAWLGRVNPDGLLAGPIVSDKRTVEVLAFIIQQPAQAAAAYGAMMGHCSFCGLPLTDEGSVTVGYGPICAQRFDLPHAYVGTPALKVVPA